MSSLRLTATALLLCSCSVHHPLPGNAVFRIETRGGSLLLVPPSLTVGVAAEPVPFIKILPNRHGYNPREQYVDLSPGMRLAVQRMVTETQMVNFYIGVAPAGRHGLRMRSASPDAAAMDQRARYMRLFYQTKYVKSPGQPVRSAICLLSDSRERLQQRTTEARDNPAFACTARECASFDGKTTVSPELPVVVNEKPRYILLGSTVRDILRTDRITDFANLRVLRKHQGRMIQVTWQQTNDVLMLPLVAEDQMSW
jgi:hypothetical protein